MWLSILTKSVGLGNYREIHVRYICLVIHSIFSCWGMNCQQKTITKYFTRYMQSLLTFVVKVTQFIYLAKMRKEFMLRICNIYISVESKWWCTYYYNTAKRKKSRTIKFLKLFNNCYHLHVIEKVISISR